MSSWWVLMHRNAEILRGRRRAPGEAVTGVAVGARPVCCGMPNCPIEAMHKIVCSSQRTVADGMIEDEGHRWEHARRIAEHFMIDRWQEVEQYRRAICHSPS